MKKLRLLTLGLLCGIILPLSTQAYEDGIYTGVDENGNEVKTVIFGGNDTFSGVQLTIKMENQSGNYYWGFNKDTTQSYSFSLSASGCTGTYLSGDGKLAGCTNGVNDARGGSGDTYENGFNPNPTNFEKRQGPCDSGYHVPSRGERNALVIAWCNIDTGCNARYSNTQSGGVNGDFRTGTNWTSGNQLIYINRSRLGTRFKNEFSMSDNNFWSSSPSPGSAYNSWCLTLLFNQVDPNITYGRSYSYRVRCLRNSIIAPTPQTFTLTFLDDGVEVSTGEVTDGDTWTGDTSAPADKEGYRFDYRYADGGDNTTGFDFNTPITKDITLQAHRTFIAELPNGIYTVDNGDKTVIWKDDIWGEINLTIAGEDLSGKYYWGWNEPANNNWSTNPTNGRNHDNDWGGSGDTYENGFDDGNERYKRQGPCPVGYHVPSRAERNILAIAWCNIYTGCNARYSDTQIEGITGDLQKCRSPYGRTENNKLINISKPGIGTIFKNTFSMTLAIYPSSSVHPFYDYYSQYINIGNDNVHPDTANFRDTSRSVHCLKNYVIPPKILEVIFISNSTHIWSGDVLSGNKLPLEVITGYNLTGLIKTGYIFSGWAISGSDAMFDVENDVVTAGMTLNAVWTANTYEVHYEAGEGTGIMENQTFTYDVAQNLTENAFIKNGYIFSGWVDKAIGLGYSDGQEVINLTTTGGDVITLTAEWTKIETKPSGGSSGGGGGGSSKDDISKDSEKSTEQSTGSQVNSLTSSQNDDDVSSGANAKDPENNTSMDSSADKSASEGQTYTPEFQQAYEFAHDNGITTKETIQKADMDGNLTRIAMAKMLSQYAINILGQKPANIVVPNFNDVTEKLNSDYDDGVTLAYQLGIMGQNMPNNRFRPNDEVTRAEFVTALSRMIYKTSDGEYRSTPEYYTNHMNKLKEEGIITKADPKMKELRGYVMIMLMRSASSS